jgi:beta-lactam-binding protein with PASTA domain
MAVDITGFQRMRREQARKQQQTEQKAIPTWEGMSYSELKAAAKEAGIKGYGKMSKAELIEALKAGE